MKDVEDMERSDISGLGGGLDREETLDLMRMKRIYWPDRIEVEVGGAGRQ